MSTHDSLEKILRTAGGKPPPKDDPLPTADEAEDGALTIADMDGRYSTMRPANRNLTRLHVMLKDGSVQSFQFAYLDARSTYNGKEFVLVFAGLKHYQITVKGHGPKFWMIYDYCTTHRWPYLRAALRDFGGDATETVLSEIEIKDVTPRESEA